MSKPLYHFRHCNLLRDTCQTLLLPQSGYGLGLATISAHALDLSLTAFLVSNAARWWAPAFRFSGEGIHPLASGRKEGAEGR